jgi:hypothetical protein
MFERLISMQEFDWLVGQWEGIQGQGIYHEEWERISPDELSGSAYMIKKGEIVGVEKLQIQSHSSGVYYIAEVSHNPGPVSFKLTSQDENIFVFENPEHDFPQKITYERIGEDKLMATVEADKGGKVRKINYELSRIIGYN